MAGTGGYAKPKGVLSSLRSRLGRVGLRRSSAVAKVQRVASPERPILIEAWIQDLSTENSDAQSLSGGARGRSRGPARSPNGGSVDKSRSESPSCLPGTLHRSESMEVCVPRMRSRSPPNHSLITLAQPVVSPPSSPPTGTDTSTVQTDTEASSGADDTMTSLASPTDHSELLQASPTQTSSPRWADATLQLTSRTPSFTATSLTSSPVRASLTSSPARSLCGRVVGSPFKRDEFYRYEASPTRSCVAEPCTFGGTFGQLSDGSTLPPMSPLVFKDQVSTSGETQTPPSRRQSSVSEPGAELSPGSSPPSRTSKRAPSPYIDEAKSLFSEMLTPTTTMTPATPQQVAARDILTEMFKTSRVNYSPCPSRSPLAPAGGRQIPQPTSSKPSPETLQRPPFPGRRGRSSRLVPLNGRCKNFPPGDPLEEKTDSESLRRPASVAGLRSVWQNTALGRIKILTPLLTPTEGSKRRSASVGCETEAERAIARDKAFEEWEQSDIPLEFDHFSIADAVQAFQDTPEFQRVTARKKQGSSHVDSGTFIVPHLETTASSSIQLRGSRTFVKTEQTYVTTSHSMFPSWFMIEQILRGQACACDNIVDQTHEFVVHNGCANSYRTVEC